MNLLARVEIDLREVQVQQGVRSKLCKSQTLDFTSVTFVTLSSRIPQTEI